MPALAVWALDVLVVLGLGTAGFLFVGVVCAGVLAMLQLNLPSTDAGAAAADRPAPADEVGADADQPPVDAGVDA